MFIQEEKNMQKDRMTLKDLAVKHPYYASDSNYYANEAGLSYPSMSDFLADFAYADIDMNLIYRWDVHFSSANGNETYWAQVFIIQQRNGIYTPVIIHLFEEKDVPDFVSLVSKHKEKLLELWKPID